MSVALEIKGLKKTYADGFQALKGIDLHVRQGDFFALLGPNGAGKSTTLGILTSVVSKSAGSVCIMGHDIDQDFQQAKQCLGVVPQEFRLTYLTLSGQLTSNCLSSVNPLVYVSALTNCCCAWLSA
ncbi:ATP-binding cassette domain-containing protein, partial [Pseudomonadales bacterium]|nr:ATP-binding cassette domain-containing protein [Pseudomonadales bacterium]